MKFLLLLLLCLVAALIQCGLAAHIVLLGKSVAPDSLRGMVDAMKGKDYGEAFEDAFAKTFANGDAANTIEQWGDTVKWLKRAPRVHELQVRVAGRQQCKPMQAHGPGTVCCLSVAACPGWRL